MRRFIPWTDIAVYGGLALLSVVASLLAVITPQEWTTGGIIAAITAPLAFVVLAIVIIGGKLLRRPDYQALLNSYGGHTGSVAVWTVAGEPVRDDMEDALSHFAVGAADRLTAIGTYHSMLHIGRYEKCWSMLAGASIEWSKGKVGAMGIGWKVKDKAGLQSGKYIKLQWTGSIKNSALFHELGHMVQELILKRPIPDYKHEDTEFWDMISEIERIYEP